VLLLLLGTTGASADVLFDVYHVAISPDGTKVVGSQGGDSIVGMTRNLETGELTYVDAASGENFGGNLAYGSMVAFAQNNTTVFGVVNGGNAIRQFEFSSSGLSRIKDWRNNLDGITGLVSPLTVTVVDNNLYVKVQSGLLTFAVSGDGSLTYLQLTAGSGTSDEPVADPTHHYLYDIQSDGLVRWSRDTTTGLLGTKEVVTTSAGPNVIDLAFSPDGTDLYGVNPNVGVLHWTVSGATATLAETVGKDVTPGLNGAWSLAVTPDGKEVVVTGQQDYALSVFSRDIDSGSLTQAQVFFDGADGVDGLNYAASVVVSPDGKSIYVAAPHDNTLGVFSRDPSSGSVTYLQAYPKDAEGAERVRTVTLSAAGNVFQGRVVSPTGGGACESHVPVLVQMRRANGSWASLWSGYTKDDGTYRGRIRGWTPGRYRAKVTERRNVGPLGVKCLEATSPILKRAG
jgi:6-phosphogluconolactonase (cycloisomerase 2 family)